MRGAKEIEALKSKKDELIGEIKDIDSAIEKIETSRHNALVDEIICSMIKKFGLKIPETIRGFTMDMDCIPTQLCKGLIVLPHSDGVDSIYTFEINIYESMPRQPTALKCQVYKLDCGERLGYFEKRHENSTVFLDERIVEKITPHIPELILFLKTLLPHVNWIRKIQKMIFDKKSDNFVDVMFNCRMFIWAHANGYGCLPFIQKDIVKKICLDVIGSLL